MLYIHTYTFIIIIYYIYIYIYITTTLLYYNISGAPGSQLGDVANRERSERCVCR